MIKLLIVLFVTCIFVSLVYNVFLNITFKQLKFAAKAVVVVFFSIIILTLITLLF